MAANKLESLVLRGVPVACDVVAGLERIGSNPATGDVPSVALSFARHLSPSYRAGDAEPASRCEPANPGGTRAAQRAGRPGSSAGVSESRSLASFAGRAILSGWSRAVREAVAVEKCRRNLVEILAPTPTGGLLSGHTQSFPRLPAGKPASLVRWLGYRGGRNADAQKDVQAVTRLAQGMPSASMSGGR